MNISNSLFINRFDHHHYIDCGGDFEWEKKEKHAYKERVMQEFGVAIAKVIRSKKIHKTPSYNIAAREDFEINKKYAYITLAQVSSVSRDFILLKNGSRIPTKSCHAIGYMPSIRGTYQWEIIAPKKYL